MKFIIINRYLSQYITSKGESWLNYRYIRSDLIAHTFDFITDSCNNNNLLKYLDISLVKNDISLFVDDILLRIAFIIRYNAFKNIDIDESYYLDGYLHFCFESVFYHMPIISDIFSMLKHHVDYDEEVKFIRDFKEIYINDICRYVIDYIDFD